MATTMTKKTQARPLLFRLAQAWVRGLTGLAVTVEGAVVTTLLGLNPAPQTTPLVSVIRRYPLPSFIIGAFVLFASFSALLIVRSATPRPVTAGGDGGGDSSSNGGDDAADVLGGWHVPRVLISAGVSTLSTAAFIALLLIVLTRPTWCPTALCPAAQRVVVTNPNGAHDSDMEIYLTAVQGTTYELPADVASYTLDNAPTAVPVLRIDDPTAPVYRVALGAHSLLQGRYSIVIERVALVVTSVPASPRPLNVWLKGPNGNYQVNPYLATYHGEGSGAVLPVTYTAQQDGFVLLSPGEADELDIRLQSRVLADLRFQVQVTYRVSNESQEHTLTLPQTFEVIFTDVSNWHLYEFQSGRLVPVHA